ncbi:tyrosyl-DNA phosphodiesterase 1, partial [Irineochytrium annulatum]
MKRTLSDVGDDESKRFRTDGVDRTGGIAVEATAVAGDPFPAASTRFVDPHLRLVKIDPVADPVDNIMTTTLKDILAGSIEAMWQVTGDVGRVGRRLIAVESGQFNYMLEPDFFFEHMDYEEARRANITFVMHKDSELEAWLKQSGRTNVKFIFAKTELYGTHHTKAMFLFYRDSTARVIIHTANLLVRDWGKKSQACWISPLLRRKSPDAHAAPFERDLVRYLAAYNDRQLAPLQQRLARYDFAPVKAVLIASVPGRHKSTEGNLYQWGHPRMGKVLEGVRLGEDCLQSSSIIMQFSSCGSLGKDDSWLTGEFAASLSHAKNRRDTLARTPIKIVFPTSEDVRRSNQGWRAGRSIPFPDKSWQQQGSYMRPLLHKWVGERAGRKHALPHIKTFSRLNEETGEVSWLLVTSHNLSKAAWGSWEKGRSQLFIRSYELGVLIHPGLFE